ncbi:nucleotidyltransferase family protein [Stappia sp. ES.058]|uniref:nucleotidyltransferase family protein n=1 Tax=Stappia sp. ES.058 TaxID=1881061 RepID=UPI00087AC741|nr:nucleotidyltransferase family protein [Stappia sp. ES.058]SDU47572.1 MurNAc alpha-1-phosphate uridylyltransferase [Stappia sp. ES.058]
MSHKTNIRRAMVLAAGMGKRMRPLTATTPKPLIPVCGDALIDRAFDKLEAAGVETCVVNVHYLADLVEVHVVQRPGLPEAIVSDERGVLLDTGGGISKALPLLGEEPFFLLNSDSSWIEGVTPNLDHLADAWNPDEMDALLLLSEYVESVGYDGKGDFVIDPTGRLERRPERTIAPFAYAGAAILHPRLFDGCPQDAFSLNRLFDVAIERGRLYGVQMEGLWLHVGTPEAVDEAERAIRNSTR